MTDEYPRNITNREQKDFGYACEYCGAKRDLEYGIRGVPSSEPARPKGDDDRLVVRCRDAQACNERDPDAKGSDDL